MKSIAKNATDTLTFATKSPFFLPLTSQSFVISSTSNRMLYVLLLISSVGAQWKDVVMDNVADIGWPAYNGGSLSVGLDIPNGL